jgi:hypothetical protein
MVDANHEIGVGGWPGLCDFDFLSCFRRRGCPALAFFARAGSDAADPVRFGLHRIKRGLVSASEYWRWSGYRFYSMGEAGVVRVNVGWTEISFRDRTAQATTNSTTLAAGIRISRPCRKRKSGTPTVSVRKEETGTPGPPVEGLHNFVLLASSLNCLPLRQHARGPESCSPPANQRSVLRRFLRLYTVRDYRCDSNSTSVPAGASSAAFSPCIWQSFVLSSLDVLSNCLAP